MLFSYYSQYDKFILKQLWKSEPKLLYTNNKSHLKRSDLLVKSVLLCACKITQLEQQNPASFLLLEQPRLSEHVNWSGI